MKTKLLLTLLMAALLLPAMTGSAGATSDIAWTDTLSENLYLDYARFSNDDSLLITRIAQLKETSLKKDTNFIVVYNSYTGEPVDTLKNQLNARYVKDFLFAPDTNLLYIFLDHHFDSVYNMVPDFRFLVYNYKTGNIVDSIFAPANEPDLRPDTSRVYWMVFTPDGDKLYMMLDVIEGYDEYYHYPIYDDQLYVWNTSDWTIHRKEKAWHSDGLIRIMPNNNSYMKYWTNVDAQGKDCFYFMDLEVDTIKYEICDNDLMYYFGPIYPKNDTNKLIFIYQDMTDYKIKYQVRNQSDFSVEKTIVNDTINTLWLQFLKDSKYIIFYPAIDDLIGRPCVFDIENEQTVYIYPHFSYVGGHTSGGVAQASNGGDLFFTGYSRTLRMLNAKYTTTSTEEPGEEPSSIIYPNPAYDYIDIAIDNHALQGMGGASTGTYRTLKDAVRVYDVLGVCVLEHPAATRHPSMRGELMRLNVSGLAAGVYFVRAGGRVYKFVKL